MRVPWSQVPLKAKKAISKGISRCGPTLTASSASAVVQGLSKTGVRWEELLPVLREDSARTLARTLPSMNEREVCSTLSALGRLGAAWASLSPELRENAFAALLRVEPSMGSRGVAMSVLGLAKTDVSVSQLPAEVTSALKELLQRSLRSANAQEVANVLYGLGRLGFRASDLPEPALAAVLAALQLEVSRMGGSGLSQALLGLARMSVPLAQLNSVTQLLLWRAVAKEAPTMSEQEITSSIYAIGSLNVTQAHIGQEATEVLVMGLASVLNSCDEQGLVMALSGLHALQLQWEQVPRCAQVELLDSLRSLLRRQPSVRLTSLLLRVLSAAGLKWAILDDELKNALRESILTFQQELRDDCSLVASLGRMGTPWLHLGTAAQEVLINGLLNHSTHISERELGESMSGMAGMGLTWAALKPSTREGLQEAIRRSSNSISEQGLAQVILSLAKMEVCWSMDLTEETKAALRLAICAQSSYGEHALSSMLYGFGKVGKVWSSLHPDVRQTLKTALVTSHVHQVWTAQGVANSLHGLASMQASWSDMSSSVRMALTEDVTKVAPLASETQLATILHSLAKLGLRWNSLTEELSLKLFASVANKLNLMNKQHLAAVVFSFGTMGLQWQQLSYDLQQQIITALLRVENGQICWGALSQYLAGRTGSHPAQSLSMMIHGLGALGVKHFIMPSELARALLNSFNKCAPCMNAVQLGASLCGLSRMGWQAIDLDNAEISSVIYSTMIRMFPYADSNDVTSMLSGLNFLGYCWKSLPSELRRAAITAAAKVCREGRPEEVAGTCFALASMECVWSLVPSRIREEIVAGILRVCEKEQMIGAHSTANLMYAVTLLTFDTSEPDLLRDLNSVHFGLLAALTRVGVGSFSEKERSQVLIFLEYLKHLTQLGDLPAHQIITQVDQDGLHMSKLQLNVVQSLQTALHERTSNYELQNEYSAFGGTLPVDATILREGKVVAFIEVDGPHHYPRGVLRRKDLLKEMLYRRKHPGTVFARVRHDQVRRLGCSEIGNRVAEFLTIVDPESEGWANRRAERELKRALSGRVPCYSNDGH